MTTTRVLLGVWLLCVAATAAAGLWLQVGISIAFALIVGLLVMLTARVTDPDYGIFVARNATCDLCTRISRNESAGIAHLRIRDGQPRRF